MDSTNCPGSLIYSTTEVENAILELDYVSEVMVYGENNQWIGSTVAADIRLHNGIKRKIDKNDIKIHCSKRLGKHKVPIKINFVNESQYGERFKKIRK